MADSSTPLPIDSDHLLTEAIAEIQDYAIFLLDAGGTILTWNTGAARITGYDADEVIGRHFSLFYTEEDISRRHPQKELKIATARGRYEEEGWRVRKDGTRFWSSVLITRLQDKSGNTIAFAKVTRDLTDRRRTEDALRESEERFRQLVNGVKDYAIFLLDAHGNVVTWNEGAANLYGLGEQEVIGQAFDRFYPPEDTAVGKPAYELQEAALTGRYEDEGWRVRRDGTRFWANVIITAVRESGSQVTGFSKITRDLTERKRAEDKLRLANEELEQRVRKRTQELEETNESLEQAIHSRDEFLSVASHELKTPITSLKLQAQMLKQRPASPERMSASIGTMLRQIDRLTTLVEDLLDVARAQAGKLNYRFEDCDLSEIIDEAASRWIDPLRASGGTLHTRIQPGVRGSLDPFRIEQVVSNLLSNSLKYAAGRRVELTLETENGSTAILRVHDEGEGIDPAKIGRIFERFERAVTSSRISGLGLGLFIVKTIVEAHHGKVGVESKVGAGTTFTVTLPLNVMPHEPG